MRSPRRVQVGAKLCGCRSGECASCSRQCGIPFTGVRVPLTSVRVCLHEGASNGEPSASHRHRSACSGHGRARCLHQRACSVPASAFSSHASASHGNALTLHGHGGAFARKPSGRASDLFPSLFGHHGATPGRTVRWTASRPCDTGAYSCKGGHAVEEIVELVRQVGVRQIYHGARPSNSTLSTCYSTADVKICSPTAEAFRRLRDHSRRPSVRQ